MTSEDYVSRTSNPFLKRENKAPRTFPALKKRKITRIENIVKVKCLI